MIGKRELESSLVAMISAAGYQDCGVAWRSEKNPKAYWWIVVDGCTRAQRDFDTLEQAQVDLDRILGLAACATEDVGGVE